MSKLGSDSFDRIPLPPLNHRTCVSAPFCIKQFSSSAPWKQAGNRSHHPGDISDVDIMDNGHAQCRKALSWNRVGSNLDFVSCLNAEHPEPLRTNLNPFSSEHIIDTVCQCWSVLQKNTTMHKQVSPENAGPSVSAVVRAPAAFGMS